LLVNRGGLASSDHPDTAIATDWKFGFPGFAWLDYSYNASGYYAPFFNRLVPDDLVGTWDGQGVFYLTVLGGTWTQMATPATMITTGDLDGDGIDDLIGVWPAQAGVWVKYSSTGTWAYIGSAPRHIATGDMDGDGRSDLLGTWDGQGVFWRKSQTGAWNYLGTPATLITSADMDGDGKDDVVGIWPSQAGVWTKYSSDNLWEYIGTSVRDFSSGKMRGGSNTWGAANLGSPEKLVQNGFPSPSQDLSANSPGGPGFKPRSQGNLTPVQDPMIQVIPGPGMTGFKYTMTPNPNPVRSPERDRKSGNEKDRH
jgi:hypothetical protein